MYPPLYRVTLTKGHFGSRIPLLNYLLLWPWQFVIPSWERSHISFQSGTFESMIFQTCHAGVCFLVPWRVKGLDHLSTINFQTWLLLVSSESTLHKKESYCWWTKSCTSWCVVYPISCRVFYIPGDCLGFLNHQPYQSYLTKVEKWENHRTHFVFFDIEVGYATSKENME